MPVDISYEMKTEVIAHLVGDPLITAVVPADQIFGIEVPALLNWPFIRYGVPISSGYEATCWDGSETRVTIHGYTESNTLMAGEDQAIRLGALLVESMNSFEGGDTLGVIDYEWINTNLLRDEPEASRWHVVTEFLITAVKR